MDHQTLSLAVWRGYNKGYYADERPRLRLAFADEETKKLHGSGYGVDLDLFKKKAPSSADIKAAVNEIVERLEFFHELNTSGDHGGVG